MAGWASETMSRHASSRSLGATSLTSHDQGTGRGAVAPALGSMWVTTSWAPTRHLHRGTRWPVAPPFSPLSAFDTPAGRAALP